MVYISLIIKPQMHEIGESFPSQFLTKIAGNIETNMRGKHSPEM